MIEIRKMTIEDFEKIKNILQTDFDDFWKPSILKSELESENSKYIVAVENNIIVGFGGIIISLDDSEITNIVTKKDYRKKGIGKLLLDKLIDITKKLGLDEISLEVNEENIPAINLYKSADFKPVRAQKKVL